LIRSLTAAILIQEQARRTEEERQDQGGKAGRRWYYQSVLNLIPFVLGLRLFRKQIFPRETPTLMPSPVFVPGCAKTHRAETDSTRPWLIYSRPRRRAGSLAIRGVAFALLFEALMWLMVSATAAAYRGVFGGKFLLRP
jgi:hypothetical protein